MVAMPALEALDLCHGKKTQENDSAQAESAYGYKSF
jgi:hypothetical protein